MMNDYIWSIIFRGKMNETFRSWMILGFVMFLERKICCTWNNIEFHSISENEKLQQKWWKSQQPLKIFFTKSFHQNVSHTPPPPPLNLGWDKNSPLLNTRYPFEYRKILIKAFFPVFWYFVFDLKQSWLALGPCS